MFSSIHIDRFDALYTVPPGTEVRPLEERLNRIVSDVLPRIWDRHVMGARAMDEAIYFIGRLDLDLALAPEAMDDQTIAGAWADTIGAEIAAAIARGDDTVVRFDDRAGFIAAFVQDLLHGTTGSHWYYQEFEPLLSSGTTPAIVRSLLLEDPDTGRDVLRALHSRGELDRLIAALGEEESDAVITRCLVPPSPRLHMAARYGTWIEALRAVVRRIGFRPSGGVGDLARLYLGLLSSQPELGPDVHLARFIREVLGLRAVIARHRDGGRALRLLASGGAEAAMALLGVADGGGRPSRTDAVDLAGLLRALEREEGEAVELLRDLGADPQPDAPTFSAMTRRGGLYLLAPSISELNLPARFEERGLPIAPLLLALLAQCAGPETAASAMADRAVRFLAGVRDPSTRETQAFAADAAGIGRIAEELEALYATLHAGLAPYQRGRHAQDVAADFIDAEASTVPHAIAERLWPIGSLVLRLFAARLGAFAESTPAYLRKNLLESPAHVEAGAESISVRFMGVPLGMVLRMAGFDRAEAVLPWLGGRRLSFRFDE